MGDRQAASAAYLLGALGCAIRLSGTSFRTARGAITPSVGSRAAVVPWLHLQAPVPCRPPQRVGPVGLLPWPRNLWRCGLRVSMSDCILRPSMRFPCAAGADQIAEPPWPVSATHPPPADQPPFESATRRNGAWPAMGKSCHGVRTRSAACGRFGHAQAPSRDPASTHACCCCFFF